MNSSISQRVVEYSGDDDLWPHEKRSTMYDILLRTTAGDDAAAITVRGDGHPFTGIEWFQPADERLTMTYRRGPRQWIGGREVGSSTLLIPPGSVPGWGRPVPDSAYEAAYDGDPDRRPGRHCSWDCREWQMWRGRSYGLEMRPRRTSAESGLVAATDGLGVWSEYEVDGVHTTQHWHFTDIAEADVLAYDCLIAIENVSGNEIVDYSQFFANYTQINGLNGCFFWHEDASKLVNFLDIFVFHLQAFVVDPASPFIELGCIPHFPRSEGLINATWNFPVLVGHATDCGWRHVILMERQYTAGISCGMKGVAMDYAIYPGKLSFDPGQRFTAHVRHLIIRSPELPTMSHLEGLWQQFEVDHDDVKKRLARR